MTYAVQSAGSYTVISLHGEIDLQCSPDTRSVILDRLGSGENVVVDLSGVSYIDSSGVASLVEGLRFAKTRGLRFALVSVSAPAMQVLELARLEKVFPIYAAVDDLDQL